MACRLSFRLQDLLSRSVTQLRKTGNCSHVRSASLKAEQSVVPPLSSVLFTKEKEAQAEDVGRIYKIKVEVNDKDRHEVLYMNKSLSTPTHCAWHLSKFLVDTSVLALVDGEPWDMSRPLEDSCNLRFLSMLDEDPTVCNEAFWRSCSFMLGAVVSNAFKDDIPVTLHSFPPPFVSSGSFVLDAAIGLDTWSPHPEELRALSAGMIKLAEKMLPFERLTVGLEVAKEMFANNPFKLNHIKNIFAQHNNVVVYRIGDHVDISRGPMMSNTSHLGRCTIASVHKIGELYRFQGVALPRVLRLNHFAYGILEDRAKKLNTKMMPSEYGYDTFTPKLEKPEEPKFVSGEK